MGMFVAKYVATTPSKVSEAILAFCRGLSAEEPVFLEVTPAEAARPGRCYSNAEQVARRLGKRVVFGWLVWELNGAYATAEHHAVVDNDGVLTDVTPQIAGERRVLFVPDRAAVAPSARQVNRYVALAASSLVHRYVALAEMNARLDVEGQAFGPKFMENDRLMCLLLDRFFSGRDAASRRKDRQKRKKTERHNKRRSRQSR